MSVRDDWPKMPDGSEFDGRQILNLARSGDSPFDNQWDIFLLVKDIEESLKTRVLDIPFVYNGSNNYGFHIKLSNHPDIIARLARGDVNMLGYDGFPIHVQVPEVQFEAAVYELLRSRADILASRLLHYRIPVQIDGPRLQRPKDISGRRLFVFERAEGENNVWKSLDQTQKDALLTQAARIRAALFQFTMPEDFASTWLRERLFEQKPKSLPIPIAGTREFSVALFTAKINATIGNLGDMIGWEDDDHSVGPRAVMAKKSLLNLIPHILPKHEVQADIYRLVLEHGDFGIHNMSITVDSDEQPLITSIYDWETGCIVPAILSDPLMAVTVDLEVDQDASPAISRVDAEETPDDCLQYQAWAKHYIEMLFKHAPEYEHIIKAGKDARHLWFALRNWRGDDPEHYFGSLGDWADRRISEIEKQ